MKKQGRPKVYTEEQCKEAVRLYMTSDLSYQEVADILHINSVASVAKMVSDVRRREETPKVTVEVKRVEREVTEFEEKKDKIILYADYDMGHKGVREIGFIVTRGNFVKELDEIK
jgi:nicotinate-nucleotide pyrophosphorylase